jgi:hypothetical protein
LLALVVAFVAGFAAIGNGSTSYAAKMLRQSDAEWQLALLYRGQPDWDAAHPILAAQADSAAVVISSSELKSMYYLHRSDVLLSVDLLGDPRKRGAEYSTFAKLVRPVVSTKSSLEELRACFPTGLLLAEHAQWRAPWGIQPAVADYIEATMTPVVLPPAAKIIAYRWREAVADSAANCATVHAVVHR